MGLEESRGYTDKGALVGFRAYGGGGSGRLRMMLKSLFRDRISKKENPCSTEPETQVLN